ncbi:MAG: histidine phosphatase family protein [Sandaracinaceae bacterium]
MTGRFPSTRTEAPAYLARYLEERARREEGAAPAPAGGVVVPEKNRPPYVDRARERARARARSEQERGEAPPGGVSEAYSWDSVSPREVVPPPFLKERMAGTTVVRLVRHGQTQSYATNAGLSALGRWQAHRKGQRLGRGLKPGMTVRFPHAPTARATETAVAMREGIMQAGARYGIDDVTFEEPHPSDRFKNFQVHVEGEEMDVTSAFMRFAERLEVHERHQGGDRPTWLVEMERFWNIQAAGGDPITQWLRTPLMTFEPAASCVRRFWRGVVDEVRRGPEALMVLVATHSGPIRAVAASAVGHDPGEPTHTEDVRIRVLEDLEHAVVTYRERALEIDIPTTFQPSWAHDGETPA